MRKTFTATLAGETRQVECEFSHNVGSYAIWHSVGLVAVMQIGHGGKLWPTKLTFFEYSDRVVMSLHGVRLNRTAAIVGWNQGRYLSEHNTLAV